MKSFSSPTISSVMRSDLCTGCGLCAGVSGGAVGMERNDKGNLRPIQKGVLDASLENKIATACPGLTVIREQTGTNYHPLWGPYESACLGWSTDEALRHHGSSGGALSAIALHLIESGQAQFVLTIRDDEDDPLSNVTRRAYDYEEIYRSAGSRYAPSAPLEDIDRFLDGPDRFAIIAKPCDISALRALSATDPRVNQKVVLYLSFFCAGVPNRKGAVEVLDKLGVQQNELHRFQYRGDGWPGYAKATRRDGTSEKMSYHDSWGKILSRHVQFRCKICPDGTGGAADIVCADAWHSDDKGYPIFDDADGQSLIMARTPAGLNVVEEATQRGYLALENFEMKALLTIQPGQTGRSRALFARLIGLYIKKGVRPRFTGFSLLRNSMSVGPISFLRNLIGTMRRA